MAIICIEGLPGKIGRCINTNPIPPPHFPPRHNQPVPAEKAGTSERGLYPEIFIDASILNLIHHTAKSISDPGTRKAIVDGLGAALSALRERGAGEVKSITLED